MQEGNIYFSGKHLVYGYKTEESVRPNELACSVINHFPASILDLIILFSRIKERVIRIEMFVMK